MVGFGYGGNPLAGKSFSFGSAFGTAATGGSPEDIFDVRKYGGDIRSRNKSIGRRAAGDMSSVLTDQQIENLGAGLADIVGLVNQRTLYDGGIGSLNNEGALTNDRVNQYFQTGDILGATGWGDVNAGSAFGTMRANAQAAKEAGNQDLYSAYTNPSNFNNLAILNRRTMGGVGQSLLYDALGNAQDAYSLGEDPYAAAGGSIFGQGQTATWGVPHQDEAPVIEGGNAPSPEPPPHAPDGAMPGTAFGQNPPAGQPHPTIPGAQWETNQSPVSGGGRHYEGPPAASRDPQTALTYAFRQAQGSDPDQAQLGYLQEIANTQGLQAAVKFAGDNIIARAHRYSQTPPPKIQNSQDVQGASALYDYIVAALGQGSINQPKDQYVNNILALYQKYGM